MNASENMELYDIETDTEVYRHGIFLCDPVTEASSPEAMCDAVERTVTALLEEKKFVTVFGGEHSVSIGVLRAFRKKYSKLSVLQIDAHTDLRPEFHGSACNHACAVYESRYESNLVQVGIRSMDVSEMEHVQQDKVFWGHRIHKNDKWMDEAIDQLGPQVYITIDLDAFDPSVLPSTGTPEPGGMQWYQMMKFLRKVVKSRQIVGFDIVELAPNPTERSSDFAAAKLYYKLLSYVFLKKVKKHGKATK